MLAARTKASGGTVLEVSAQVLEKITRRDNPQNVVGVFRQRFAPEAAIGRDGIWVALDRVRDPGNLGTIIRTADAAGLAGVALVGASCDAVRGWRRCARPWARSSTCRWRGPARTG